MHRQVLPQTLHQFTHAADGLIPNQLLCGEQQSLLKVNSENSYIGCENFFQIIPH